MIRVDKEKKASTTGEYMITVQIQNIAKGVQNDDQMLLIDKEPNIEDENTYKEVKPLIRHD